MLNATFNKFIPQYNKNYKNQQEYNSRKAIFQQNLAMVLNHDPEVEGFEIALNKFSDWTDEEFNSLFKLGSTLAPDQKLIKNEHDDLDLGQGFYRPKKKQQVEGKQTNFIDWRTRNAVTNPKDQMKCAACYAFAATAAVESAYAIKTGKLVSFSEQQIIDCS